MLYMLKFSEEKNKEDMIKSNGLFQNAIALLYQNTENRIHEATILNYMAANYLTAGDTEKGLEILKQNNICDMNSSLIGYIYAVELKNPKEAEKYLFSSMSDILNKVIRTISGMAFVYAEKEDKNCMSVALWLMQFFDSLKTDSTAISFLDKFKAILLAQCAVWQAALGQQEEAREYITNAYDLAKRFDESPVYTLQGIKFFEGMETEGVSFDGIGKTAMEAAGNFVFGKTQNDKMQQSVREMWEELKDGCKDA